MKCNNCGAELTDGAIFCRECGAKLVKARFCRECGTRLDGNAKFCTNCGAKINADIATANETEGTVPGTEKTKAPAENETNVDHETAGKTGSYTAKKAKSDVTLGNKNTGSSSACKNKQPKSYSKKNGTSFLNDGFTEFADSAKTAFAGISDSFRDNINKGTLGKNKNISFLIVLVAVLAVLVAILLPVISGISKHDKTSNTEIIEEKIPLTIEKGSQYAYMSDEQTVYIATAISDSIINVEKWTRGFLSDSMNYSTDIGSYKINDEDNEFEWLDDSQMAFSFSFRDSNNSSLTTSNSIVFTLDMSMDDVFKGSNYDDSIAYYTYRSDEGHEYRAIPLNDTLIKIESWSKRLLFDDYYYGWDFRVIDTSAADDGFEWSDDEHTAFTIQSSDRNNSENWSRTALAAFKRDGDSQYESVADYLEAREHIWENKPQKDGFDESTNQAVTVGAYTFSIPDYYAADITEDKHYRAYAETSGKIAFIEIYSAYDEEDQVTFELLKEETDNGKMSESFESWFESCESMSYEEKGFSGYNGYLFSGKGTLSGYDKTVATEVYTYPDEADNEWIFVYLAQSANTDYSYTDDFEKILASIRTADSAAGSDTAAEDTAAAENDSITEDGNPAGDADAPQIISEPNARQTDEATAQPDEDAQELSDEASMESSFRNENETTAAESKYDYAYRKDYKGSAGWGAATNYSICYLIDTDTKECIYFSSTDGYGYHGVYTGDETSKIIIKYTTPGFSDGYIETMVFENGIGSNAKVTNGDSSYLVTTEFQNVPVDSVEKYLKSIN